MWQRTFLMVTVGEVSSTSPASKCQPGERSWPPANAHGTGLPRETPHTATERRSNRRWSSVLHKFPNPRCIHPTLSFPPWLPPRAYSQPSGMFFYRWCREEFTVFMLIGMMLSEPMGGNIWYEIWHYCSFYEDLKSQYKCVNQGISSPDMSAALNR